MRRHAVSETQHSLNTALILATEHSSTLLFIYLLWLSADPLIAAHAKPRLTQQETEQQHRQTAWGRVTVS